MLTRSISVLHVADSIDAENFYCQKLGFQKQFAYRPADGHVDPCYLGITCDRVWLHLSSFPGDGVAGGVVNLYVDDVDKLYSELISKGVTVDLSPTDQSWGTREMYVKDADRNTLRFVQDPTGSR